MPKYESIGMIASLFVLASMSIRSSSTKGNIIMRLVNMVGCVMFVIYGLLLPTYSTAMVNFFGFVIHLYYVIKEFSNLRGIQNESIQAY